MSFTPPLTIGDHRCTCGRPVDEDGNCYHCDATEPEADSAPVRTSHYASLPADDPRRFSFDLPREDNPTPFGFGSGSDRIRSHRGPRVAAAMRDLKKGDRVMVYEDPVTKKRPEGSAVVVKVLRQTLDDLGAYVTVRFDPEKLGYEGERFDRFVIEDAVCLCSSSDEDVRATECTVHGRH